MSSVEERFCLRWNDFESNVCSGFKDIREDQDFLDVTLACGGNKQIQAHKVILSACSPFFKSILKNNPHQHPLLYLKGVKYEEVKSVLDFMYHGEVNVAQEDLSSFLSVAKELEVKGLTQVDKEENNKDCIQNRRGRNKSVDEKARKKSSDALMSQEKYIQNNENETAVITDINEQEMIADRDTNRQIKTEQSVIMDCDASQEILAEPTEDVNDYRAYNSDYAYDHEYVDDQFGSGEQQGHDLAQDFGIRQNLSWNAGRSEKKNVPCEICFKTFSSKDSLRNHLGIHKGRTTCTICQKVFATISSLNLHIKNSHFKDL